eukprot:48230-Pyramimonas_sp.AAC.1
MVGSRGQVTPIHMRNRTFWLKVKRSDMTSGMEVISSGQTALEGRPLPAVARGPEQLGLGAS